MEIKSEGYSQKKNHVKDKKTVAKDAKRDTLISDCRPVIMRKYIFVV